MNKQLENKIDELARDWTDKVRDRAFEVDPGNEHEWYSLSIGFFLGRGFSADESHEITLELNRRNLL